MTTTTTDTVPGRAATLEFAPYVFFYGRCEEAFAFYKSVLGGTYELKRNADSPMRDQVPEAWHDKIMHGRFTAPGVVLLGSDGRGPQSIDPDAGNIALTLTANDAAEGQRIFDALSQGGTVSGPFDDAFWGGKFGMLVDRFGIEWMVTSF
jgi:PhnB protein